MPEELIGYVRRKCPECGTERNFKVIHLEKNKIKYECVICERNGWQAKE